MKNIIYTLFYAGFIILNDNDLFLTSKYILKHKGTIIFNISGSILTPTPNEYNLTGLSRFFLPKLLIYL